MASDLSSPDYAAAIGSVETGGAANPYTSLGPETKGGDRAHGKYQIMSQNIGPWSKEILGQEITPQQFLDNPQLQDAIFQGKFNQYVSKYGPEGAAKAWFAGEKGMNNPSAKDVLGTSVSGYGAKFMKALGAPQASDAPAAAPQGPAMTQASPPIPIPVSSQGMPAYGWTPNNAPAASYGAQGQAQPPQEPMASPQMQLAPPIAAPRRPPDLTQLQAILQQIPAHSAGFRFSRNS